MPYTPQRVMVIMAHPDDIEFSCAGTIARWTQAGADVEYVLCTSGDVGIDDLSITRAQAAEIREAEQTAAAKVVGVNKVVFLREPDGMLENTMALRRRLVREIRRFKPEVVITSDPTVLYTSETYINHPDHRAAGTAAIDAVFPAAGQPHLFQELENEGLTAHKVRKVYVVSFREGDTSVDITATIDLKIKALREHISQMKEWDPEPMLREWSTEIGKGKEMDFAEAFRVITLISDEDYAKKLEESNNGAKT